jgi:hypothetical protein
MDLVFGTELFRHKVGHVLDEVRPTPDAAFGKPIQPGPHVRHDDGSFFGR